MKTFNAFIFCILACLMQSTPIHADKQYENLIKEAKKAIHTMELALKNLESALPQKPDESDAIRETLITVYKDLTRVLSLKTPAPGTQDTAALTIIQDLQKNFGDPVETIPLALASLKYYATQEENATEKTNKAWESLENNHNAVKNTLESLKTAMQQKR